MLKRTTSLSFFDTQSLATGRLAALSLTVIFLICAARPSSAQAQSSPDGESEEETEDGDEVSDTPMTSDVDASAVRHGIGLRLRQVFMPKGMIEIFMEQAASGMSNTGFGFDYVRRKKDVEISVGFEYDKLSADNGYYVESGGELQTLGDTDFVEFDNLSWMTIDASIVYHKELSSLVSLRYGGGLGLSIVRGDIYTTDAACGADVDTCMEVGVTEKEDFFRFPPVFNLVGGVQLTPGDNIAINFEVGMRTVFYSGIGVQYFF